MDTDRSALYSAASKFCPARSVNESQPATQPRPESVTRFQVHPRRKLEERFIFRRRCSSPLSPAAVVSEADKSVRKYSPQIFRGIKEFFTLDSADQIFSNLRKRIDAHFGHPMSALQCGITNNSTSLLELLVMIGTDLNAETFFGETPLNLAIRRGYLSIVEFLLDLEVGANMPNKEGNTPHHCALIEGRADIVKVLLSKRFNNISFTDDMDVVKFLLDKEDEVIIPGINFSTLLYFSVGISDNALKLVLSKFSTSYFNATGPCNESLLQALTKNGNKK